MPTKNLLWLAGGFVLGYVIAKQMTPAPAPAPALPGGATGPARTLSGPAPTGVTGATAEATGATGVTAGVTGATGATAGATGTTGATAGATGATGTVTATPTPGDCAAMFATFQADKAGAYPSGSADMLNAFASVYPDCTAWVAAKLGTIGPTGATGGLVIGATGSLGATTLGLAPANKPVRDKKSVGFQRPAQFQRR